MIASKLLPSYTQKSIIGLGRYIGIVRFAERWDGHSSVCQYLHHMLVYMELYAMTCKMPFVSCAGGLTMIVKTL